MNENYFTGFDHILDNDKKYEAMENFVDMLPHGSGIDADWGGYMSKDGRFVRFINDYHCMNERGFYVGWQDFTILVPVVLFDLYIQQSLYYDNDIKVTAILSFIAQAFILQFNGDRYLSIRYDLRDYLTDTVYYALDI